MGGVTANMMAQAQPCYSKGDCNTGYMDKTNGDMLHWACGSSCEGGPYTDSYCNCACIVNAPCSSSLPFINNTQWQLIMLVCIIGVIFCNAVICCGIKRHYTKKK
eukprot:335790_1